MESNKFQERLRLLREEKGTPRYKLSHLCGMSDNTIGRYEDGTAEPTRPALESIAEFFDVSIDYLVGRTDNRGSHKL